MVGDITNLTNYKTAVNNFKTKENESNDLWSSIADICNSHKLLYDLFNIQQERIIHLERMVGSSAVMPEVMQ